MGKGKAGMRKGGWTWTVKYDRYRFGKHGLHRPVRTIAKIKILNLGQLNNMIDSLISQKIAKEEGGTIQVNLIDIGITKVLGSGKLSRPINITAPSFSKIAIEKIQAAGGTAIIPNE